MAKGYIRYRSGTVVDGKVSKSFKTGNFASIETFHRGPLGAAEEIVMSQPLASTEDAHEFIHERGPPAMQKAVEGLI